MLVWSLLDFCCKMARKLRKVYFRPIRVTESMVKSIDSVF
ncbi:hypothetical protein LINPERHAP2_LOCUS6607 [Linum perenne]